ncbi:MAG: V-type ATP synthase subunit I [Firmicutes bacterium]|nr:V-type ATP synthase subunit I [Bacillota bacterium]MDD3850564.1 V-type ATP synthase subunit I [Bacillota bacterium]MDD4707331.1 V-type ATP synthase subunit I [Bacillota bacterium]
MAIVDVKKMSVIALRRDRSKLVETFQKLGKVEIIDIRDRTSQEDWEKLFETQESARVLTEIQGKLGEVQFALDFMARYAPAKKSLFAEKPAYGEAAMEDLSRSEELWAVVKECRELETRLNGLRSEEMRLLSTVDLLKPWESLDVPVQELKSTEKVAIFTGSLPVGVVESVKVLLRDKAPESALEVISTDRELACVLLVYRKSLEQEVSEILKENSWSKIDLPQVEGTPAGVIEQAAEKQKEFERIRQEIADRAVELSAQRPDLEVVYDYYNLMSGRMGVERTVGNTRETFYMEGWVAKPDIEKVKKTLLKRIPEAYITFNDPDDEDDAPVVLKNPAFVEPFEMITDLYSPPGRKDFDPNTLVSIFYFIFFGMMISDAGYGIVLTLLGLWALKTLKPKGMLKKLMGLITLGGISTVFWGAMFGGWFGDLFNARPLWMNPLEDPMSLLVFSFALGIIQIFVGLGAAAYKNIKSGNVLDAVFDQGLWAVLLVGLIMFAFPTLGGVAKVLAIAGAVGLILTQGRSKPNILGKLSSGILSLYDVTGYLSDVLSYSRILALGLATGVIAMVVNTMAKMLGFNIIGYVLMAVALVVGHVFNIAINALGAYVHSSRLQYVEFFGKFYEGGGRTFNPFVVKTKYTNLMSEEEF